MDRATLRGVSCRVLKKNIDDEHKMSFKRSLTDNQKKAAMVGVIALVIIGLFATYVLLYSNDEEGETDGGSQMRAGVGDRGNGGHGRGGRGGGCFSQGTLVVMADGQTKRIEQIRPGELTLKGGLVRATIRFVASEAAPTTCTAVCMSRAIMPSDSRTVPGAALPPRLVRYWQG